MGPLLTFFTLTFSVTWACYFAAFALSTGTPEAPALAWLRLPLLLLGTCAPSLVALALTSRADGSEGVAALLRRIARSDVAVRWYAFAVSYLAAIKLAVALVLRIATGTWPRFGDVPWYLIAAAIVVSTPVQAGEEIGWRGYALPRLAERIGLGSGSLLLGVIWAVWHLPLFFIPGVDNYGQSFPVFLLGTTALSVALAWLYARTNGSLLLVMLMHSAVNQTVGIVPSAVPGATNPFALSPSPVAWLTLAFVWATAACFLARMPRTAIDQITN